jgi:accessory gene regulator B
MSYLALSRRIAEYLVTRTNAHVGEDVLAYAVEVLFLNILSVILALLLAHWAKVLLETLFCLGTVAVLRFFAGGAHSASAARCTIVTGSVFPSLGFVAQRIAALSPAAAGRLPVVACVLGLIAMTMFAPVDSPAAPIISRQRRRRLKSGSIITVALLSTVALVLGNSALRASISLGILWSGFILTPAAHKLFCIIDSLNLQERGGVRN